MEHRWGERIAVDCQVRLQSLEGDVAVGRIDNVSTSGAFIRTNLPLIPLTRVNVDINGCDVPAYVVRSFEGAVAVEWCELAPGIISALILAQPLPRLAFTDSSDAAMSQPSVMVARGQR
jgi:hypothetical protein